MKTFYSNGKLLITGEYLVLDGAKALALPTKLGQTLSVEENKIPKIYWKSFDVEGNIWFEIELDTKTLTSTSSIKSDLETRLVSILAEAKKLNPNFLKNELGYRVETHLGFPKNWGLGTSSTLINNIAQWANIDAYKLLETTFGGSGYDIACAQNNKPLFFKLEGEKPMVSPTYFNPDFKQHLYFVYLNEKRNSRDAILKYRQRRKNLQSEIEAVNGYTDLISKSKSLKEFSSLLEAHENLIGSILKETPVKELRFNDFSGTVKSLGAWGGDFVLVASRENPTSYFNKKGFNTILCYDDLILS